MSNTFNVEADAHYITISRGDKFRLKLAPAEVDKATGLLGIALGMEAMSSLPSHIDGTPFVVRFFADNKLALERQDESGSIPFKWAEADELIVKLQDGLLISVNERKLVKGARGTGATTFSSEPFI